ncbi:3-oxoacyl-ACP synthase [Geobacter hydrogenophilus]|nr:3-oxoacyl-ACP synthase [Geobacter hydrogenophilus]
MNLFSRRPAQPSQPPQQQQVERIAITGMGLLCPVGGTAWGAALAMRKKISSFMEHETVLVADDRYGTVLRGATISRVPDEVIPRDLCGSDRAVALLSPAIRQCIVGFSSQLLKRAVWLLDDFSEPAAQDFRARLRGALPDLPIPEAVGDDLTAPAYPRCAFFERIIQAAERLRQGKEQLAIVGCADSHVTAPSLEELLYAGRLKDAANPEGILVGEAAGAILLETETHARQRNATILATIGSWGRGTEPNPWTGTKPSIARGITDAFLEAFESLDDKGESIGTVIADLNGERARALEWGLVEGRVFPPSERERALKHPADTLGDCGGAMGAAMMVDALAGFMLHHNAPRRVALSTSDEAGERRVIFLERGDRVERRPFMNGLRKELNMEKQPALPEEDT